MERKWNIWTGGAASMLLGMALLSGPALARDGDRGGSDGGGRSDSHSSDSGRSDSRGADSSRSGGAPDRGGRGVDSSDRGSRSSGFQDRSGRSGSSVSSSDRGGSWRTGDAYHNGDTPRTGDAYHTGQATRTDGLRNFPGETPVGRSGDNTGVRAYPGGSPGRYDGSGNVGSRRADGFPGGRQSDVNGSGRYGNDNGVGARNPSERPGRDGGSLRNGSSGTFSDRSPGRDYTPGSFRGPQSPASWRPPSRGGVVGRGGVRAGYEPGHAPIVHIGEGHRPPRVDRDHWFDGGYRPRSRTIFNISIGLGSPCYDYSSSLFVGVNFYYPYYYCGPFHAGIYYSPFFCYDNWAPEYIYPERVIVVEKRVYLRDVIEDDDDYDLYSSTSGSLQDTLDDIKSAWVNGDGGRMLEHIGDSIPIRVYQKGKYSYSVQPDDYRDMAKDALNRVKTDKFEWTNIDRSSTDEVHVEARQEFTDPDGDAHTVKLTFTLEKAKGSWWITETGTSKWGDD